MSELDWNGEKELMLQAFIAIRSNNARSDGGQLHQDRRAHPCRKASTLQLTADGGVLLTARHLRDRHLRYCFKQTK